MIQTIKTLIENADNVYEKIVQCQKAGKVNSYVNGFETFRIRLIFY